MPQSHSEGIMRRGGTISALRLGANELIRMFQDTEPRLVFVASGNSVTIRADVSKLERGALFREGARAVPRSGSDVSLEVSDRPGRAYFRDIHAHLGSGDPRLLSFGYTEQTIKGAPTSCRAKIEFIMCLPDQDRFTGDPATRSGSFSPESKPAERFFLRRSWSNREAVRRPIFTSARTRRSTFSRGL